jgi:hypothetical protein
MKKVVFSVLCTLFFLIIASCASINSSKDIATIDELAYRVTYGKHDDLVNPSETYSIPIYKDYYDTILIEKIIFTGKKTKPHYYLHAVYKGTDWRFMDGEVIIKADEKLYTYKDDKPYRTIGTGYVLEQIFVDITDFINTDLAPIKTLKIQYDYPMTISDEGVSNLKRFCVEMKTESLTTQ